MSLRERVRIVVSQVLGIPVGALNDDSSPENIASWDSLKHMNLVLALEEEFRIRFTDEKILAMLTVRSITDSVSELSPQEDRAAPR
jgi:acyl carrier protein